MGIRLSVREGLGHTRKKSDKIFQRVTHHSSLIVIKMLRSDRMFNNCGLPSSLYLKCYPESLSENAHRAASNSSMLDNDVFHHSEYGGEHRGAGRTIQDKNAKTDGVKFYIGEDEEVMGDSATPAVRQSDSLSLYEEECQYGLQKVLTKSLNYQFLGLFASNFGLSTSVIGLTEVLPPIVNDLLHLSEDEPYGVRGANLIVRMDKSPGAGRSSVRKSSVMSSTASSASVNSGHSDENHSDHPLDTKILGTLKLCMETVTTFELILTLREGKNLAVLIRNWMAANVFKSKQIVVIEPQFTLRKKKLYR